VGGNKKKLVARLPDGPPLNMRGILNQQTRGDHRGAEQTLGLTKRKERIPQKGKSCFRGKQNIKEEDYFPSNLLSRIMRVIKKRPGESQPKG